MSPRSRLVGATRSREEEALSSSLLTEPLLPEEQGDREDSPTPTTPPSNENDHVLIQQQTLSRNVPIVLAYTLFAFAGRSVWSESVLSNFVFLLRNHDYRAVGLITAVMGLAQLITSFPAGYLADRYRRDTLLRVAAVVALLAMGSTLYAVYDRHYPALVVGLAVWGSFWGISNTAMSAIFADSVPTGQRSQYFTKRSILVNAGFATGPVVSLTLFAILGNEWTIPDCAMVLAVGQAICFPAVILLCFLSDDHIVSQDEMPTIGAGDNHDDDDDEDNERSESDPPIPSAELPQPTHENIESIPRSGYWSFLRSRRIAVLIAAADVLSGLASGMSIRFFPIFFVEKLNMGPVLVQVLYVLTPCFLAVCMKLGQKWSTRWGRCRISVAFKWSGVVLMYILVVAYQQNAPRWLVCTLYIIRTVFINSTGALTRSVLMDHVPQSERGRWAALESLNMFSWSGSAALGGYLVGMIGMVPMFCTTAAIQFLATLPLVVLSFEETLEGEQHESSFPQQQPSASTSSLAQLLIDDSNRGQPRRGSV